MASQAFFSLLDSGGLVGSSQQILANWLLAMRAQFPGYVPAAGNLEYIQSQIFSVFAADVALQCSTGASAIFYNFGTQLIGLPPLLGSPALALVRVTAGDSAGHTLPAGSQLILTMKDSTPVGFASSSDAVIPPGSTSVDVPVFALSPGAAANGAENPSELNAPLAWVNTVSTIGPGAGGVDPEDELHYLNRLRQELQLLAPRPITAADYATFALGFPPAPGTDQQEVGRATSIDGYNPADGTYGNERHVCVAITDANGMPLDADTIAAVKAWFQTYRELNFIVDVVSPNYSTVYAAVTFKTAVGWTASAAAAAVQSTLLAYLNPTQFGGAKPILFGSAGSGIAWQNSVAIHLSRVEALVQNVQAVDYIPPGGIALDLHSPPTNTTSDLVLPGAFPLPISDARSIPLTSITAT